MKTINNPIPNQIADFVIEQDVLGQNKPNRIAVFKRLKYKLINIPNLNVSYANLGKRTFAFILDLVFFLCVMSILEWILFHFKFTNKDVNVNRILIVLFFWLFYNAVFLSSTYQATIGKLIMGIKVIDLYGRRITILRASFRCITTLISVLPFGIGIWYLTTDRKKRSWHDLISGTYVINN